LLPLPRLGAAFRDEPLRLFEVLALELLARDVCFLTELPLLLELLLLRAEVWRLFELLLAFGALFPPRFAIPRLFDDFTFRELLRLAIPFEFPPLVTLLLRFAIPLEFPPRVTLLLLVPFAMPLELPLTLLSRLAIPLELPRAALLLRAIPLELPLASPLRGFVLATELFLFGL
jgi:hypothetical protein